MRNTLILLAALSISFSGMVAQADQEGEGGPATIPLPAKQSLNVNIDKDGQCSVDGKPVPLDKLSEVVARAAKGKPEGFGVKLIAAHECRFDRINQAIIEISKTRVKKVVIAQLVREVQGKDSRPNVLLILVDDLGYGDLSSYGAKDIDSPHIDRLVKDGMKMTQFYANCPVCSPTRAALLTGRFQDCVGVPGVIRTHARNSWGYLDPKAELLPSVLKKAGYHTVIDGKWHLGLGEPNIPTARGFDEFYGFLGDMMDDYYKHRRHGVNYMRLGTKEIDPKGHATDLFSDWAAEWLAKYKGDKPFFIYLAYNAPHSPVQPPKEWLERYRKKHPDVPMKRAKFAAFVEHLDDGVGRVMAALKTSGKADNTLIFFTSDNGGAGYHGASNGILRGGKQDMFEGGIREPMCAVWPGHIKPGSQSDRVAMTMDLFPTICEAAGAKFDKKIEGISILPTLLGKPQPPEDRYLFWVRLEGGRRYNGKPYYAARHGDWKLLQNAPGQPYQLFNIKEDISEKTDQAKEHPEIFNRLKKALDEHIKACKSVPWQAPGGVGPGELQ